MKKLILLAALAALPVMSHAESKTQGSGPSPYVECGIGAALFPETHWAAVTSNVIWDLGSTAITSALSSPETCNGKKVKTATLILETLDGMEKDLAVGGGQYTTALADTVGIPDAERATFLAQLREDYARVLALPGYADASKPQRATDLYASVKHAASVATTSAAADL
jgi:hypothetical protein